jgi:hypothetical protein
MRHYTALHALGSLAVVFAIVTGATSLRRDGLRRAERRAIAAVAAQTGRPATSLHATLRSELRTARFEVLRVRGAGLDVTVAMPLGSEEVLVGGSAATLAQVTRAEDASRRLGELGAFRVAGWVAALGDGRCAPPADARKSVSWRHLGGGGAELRYRFLAADARGHATWRHCVIVLAADGAPADVRVEGNAQGEGAVVASRSDS